MADRHTLSMMDWHQDGTSASSVWQISEEEREQVEALLSRRSDVEGLVTAEQAVQARAVTSSWLTCANEDSRL